MQYFTSEIGSLIAGEEQRSTSDFIRNPFASHRDIGKKLRQEIFGNEIDHACHVRIDVARTYRVHSDALGSQQASQLLRQHPNR